MKKIFVITESYPFSSAKEAPFLEPELGVLRRRFDVTLIPLSNSGYKHEITESIKIMADYSERYRSSNFLLLFKIPLLIFDIFFYIELLNNFYIFFNIKAIKRLIRSCLRRKEFYSWLKKKHQVTNCFDNAIIYTYWFDYATSAAIDLCKKIDNSIVCTRAHGYDLYRERHSGGFIPFRKIAVHDIDNVFLVSENGYKYLSNAYPKLSDKFIISTLGINNKNISTKKSTDEYFRIVSCFFISPVKRVKLIIQVICILSECVDKKIEWFHIGGGQELESIKQYTAKILKGKASYTFFGNISNDNVFSFYKNNPVDLFIMLSESEGKPVALMEAMSVSLPIVATNVGGIPEMVINGVNGVLIDVDEIPENIALEIQKLIMSPEILDHMRSESYRIWQKNANAEVNFNVFADQLINLHNHKERC